MAVFFG